MARNDLYCTKQDQIGSRLQVNSSGRISRGMDFCVSHFISCILCSYCGHDMRLTPWNRYKENTIKTFIGKLVPTVNTLLRAWKGPNNANRTCLALKGAKVMKIFKPWLSNILNTEVWKGKRQKRRCNFFEFTPCCFAKFLFNRFVAGNNRSPLLGVMLYNHFSHDIQYLLWNAKKSNKHFREFLNFHVP